MPPLESFLITPSTSLREALARIDAGAIQVAAVVDDRRRLLGLVTDGDVRRGLLRGLSLEDPVNNCINQKPLVARVGTPDAEILAMMKRAQVHQVPLVDAEGVLIEVKSFDKMIKAAQRPHKVVIMAGGLGSRLGDLTRNTPKPMLPVGSRPLLDTIIQNFCAQGFSNIALAVNYRREVIEEYFGDGAHFGCNIEYLVEPEALGTAGALGLLAEQEHPVLVSNGDLIHRVDLDSFLGHHVQSGAAATMAVRMLEHQIPYGVVQIDSDARIVTIEEKPVQRYMIAGGLYVLEPGVLREIDGRSRIDMPDVFSSVLASGRRAAAFPIEGYWLDIGRVSDYEKAQRDVHTAFRG